MTLEVFYIKQDALNKQTINRIAKVLPTRAKTIEGKLSFIVNKLGHLAEDALKSKVPIKTGQLRDQHIHLDLGSPSNPEARVYIDGGLHTYEIGSMYNTTEKGFFGSNAVYKADQLAILLDENSLYNRSQSSNAIPPFEPVGGGSPTAGWIQKAKDAFNRQKRELLNG